jgi:hypothetical protein
MLHERLRDAWHAREQAIAISPVLTLAPQGLVLGAGTVLVPADGTQYADFLKPLINPDAPTPSGYAYFLPNPKPGRRFVSYDDCEKKTSILFEFKGDYGGLLMFDSNARESFLDQSLRQIAASGARPVVWIFANRQDAERTRKLFEDTGEGREYITIVHVPWTTRGTR